MKEPKGPSKKGKGPRFPWLLLLALLASIYLFWILPIQLGPPPVQVEFEGNQDSK